MIVTFTCTPAIGDPIVKTVTVVSEGANQAVNSTCTDLGGDQVSAGFTGINIDNTPPGISVSANVSGQPYFGDVTAQQVTVTFNCTDFGGSGTTAPLVRQVFESDGIGQIAESVCTDIAGNTSTSTFGPINIAGHSRN